MGTIRAQSKQPLARNAQLVPIALTRPWLRPVPQANIVHLEPISLNLAPLATVVPQLQPLQHLAQMANIETLQLSIVLLVVQVSNAMINLEQYQ